MATFVTRVRMIDLNFVCPRHPVPGIPVQEKRRYRTELDIASWTVFFPAELTLMPIDVAGRIEIGCEAAECGSLGRKPEERCTQPNE